MKQPDLEPLQRRHLIELAGTYAKVNKLKLATVSRQAHGDPPFFDRLKADERTYQKVGQRTNKKGSFTARVYDKLVSWFYERWPPGADYPEIDITSFIERKLNGKAPRFTESQQDGKTTESRNGEKAAQDQGESGTESGSAAGILARLRRNVGQ